MAEKKTAKIEEMLHDGAVLKSFGSKFFTSIVLVPDICKAKVEMVEIGKKGQNANTVYLDLELLRQLFADIDAGIFTARIKADKGNKYPSAYQFVTGEDGSKKVNIGASQKSGHIAFQTQVKKGEKWDNRIMAIAVSELVQAGFLFKLCLGLIPTDNGSYYDRLKGIFNEGIVEKQKYFNKNTAGESQDEATESAQDEVAPKPEAVNTQASNTYVVKVTGNPFDKKDFTIFPVQSVDGKEFKLMFRKGTELEGLANGVSAAVHADEKDGYLLFRDGYIIEEGA